MSDNLKTPGAAVQSGQNTKRDELLLLINSLNPIITVETTEEERLEGLLLSISVQLVVPLYTWSVTRASRSSAARHYMARPSPNRRSRISRSSKTTLSFCSVILHAIATTIASAAACAISRINSAPRAAPS